MFAQSESAKWLWQFFEEHWEHWAPNHTVPKASSPMWHGDAESRLHAFMRERNHGLGQVKRQLVCFKRQKCPQLGPGAKATASASDIHRSCHVRMPSLAAVAQAAIDDTIKAPGLCTTSLDFVHCRQALEQLVKEPRHRLKQRGALCVNQLLACLSICRAKVCANTLTCNSRMETMRRELAGNQLGAWTAGDATLATFGQGPLRDILPALAVLMAGAEFACTRKGFGALVFTAYEDALYTTMCHWLDRGTPGMSWPRGCGDEAPHPPPNGGHGG